MTTTALVAPCTAIVVTLPVAPGDLVRAGDVVAIVEAMKMEHEVRATCDGRVEAVVVEVGDTVADGAALVRIVGADAASAVRTDAPSAAPAAAAGRPTLGEMQARHALTLDAARPAAIAKRHALGLRTARENIADLCDPGSFIEYGALAVAAQSRRRDADELMRATPADGIVTGIGTIDTARCAVLAYDATVLAGTQGHRSHQKTDRLLALAWDEQLPVVLFAEGGGGRPGDVDLPIIAGLQVPTFARFARLAGRVPVVTIVAGRCFAGNAALAATADLLIATRGANLGMAGPAMIEGGGLGRYTPEEIGPAPLLAERGVVDLLADDEADAVRRARRFLGFTRGDVARWSAHPQAPLRDALPAARSRVYDVRPIVERLVDVDSSLELGATFGTAVLTFLARIAGRPVALVVSQSASGGGALDLDATVKLTRFFGLCERFDLPIVALVDTPGFMVGPDSELRGLARRAGELFVAGVRVAHRIVGVVLRRGYGLGAMALVGGGFHEAAAVVSWPTGEFGAMGIEGSVRLGYRKELDAVPAGPERDALESRLIDEQLARGSALNMAATLELDAVIDPAETRDWIARRLFGVAATPEGGAPA